MLQHDLRTEEVGRGATYFTAGEYRIYAWCICGGWVAGWAKNEPREVVRHFMIHLNDVRDGRELVSEGMVSAKGIVP